LAAASPALAQAPHRCAGDAAKQALKLLKFHTDNDDRGTVDGERIKTVGSVKALRGKGRFDVLEVQGSVYKADYRMRLIYAQVPGSCVLMGQEVLEASDPY
jgi:hypothetical protein